MGACKEKKKRKRATKALEKACEYLIKYEYCPVTVGEFSQEMFKEFGCVDCVFANAEPLKCWKKYFYREVENGTQNETEEARDDTNKSGCISA